MRFGYHSEPQHDMSYSFMKTPDQLKERHHRYGVETTWDDHYWTYVQCPADYYQAHLDSIVIAVKGVCRGNGTHDSQGAIGVFFHDENRLNQALALADANTSQRADLHAALQALELALRIRRRNKKRPCPPEGPYRKLRRVVIKTNSMYLVDAMTKHIDRWHANNFINAKGQDVVNEDLFRKLDEAAEDLRDMKVVLQFWHVSKGSNRDAHILANKALEAVDRRNAEVMRRLLDWEDSSDDSYMY